MLTHAAAMPAGPPISSSSTIAAPSGARVRRLDVAALWLAYVLVLVASVTHVARAFASLEHSGEAWAGWMAAAGLDLGLAVLARAAALAGARRLPGAGRLRAGLVVFALLSSLANLDHALGVLAPAGSPDPWVAWAAAGMYGRFRLVLLSATLPGLVVLLAHAAEVLARLDLGGPAGAQEAATGSAAVLPAGRVASIGPVTVARHRPLPAGLEASPAGAAAAQLRQAQLLDLVRNDPTISARSLATRLEIHRTTVALDLSRLTESGALVRQGRRWLVLDQATTLQERT